MPSAKTVWGIDVGQCALKALRLQWRDGKLRALGFDVIEHAKILSQPDADEQALIRSALGKFTSRNSLKGSTIVISVPGQASFTRFIKLPPVETKKIPEIVRYEARQQIPFNLEDVVWDYQTIAKPATAGPREVEVGIFAMKKDIVNDYVSDFLAMRIEPDVVQMAPVALYNYLRYDKKEGAGATLLMDVGAENTNLVIADGERVWIRNVPIGGNNFTNALAREFKLPFSKAENLKRHAAESKHSRQVFQAMHPIYGDLLTEVQRSIGYYTSLHRDSRVERVVGLGNSFRLPGLGKYISQNLGVDVQVVDKIASLAEAEALSAPLFKENVLSFGTAFGLAIQGLGIATIQTSLLPPEILSAKVYRRKRPFFVVAGVTLLGAVGCFAYDHVTTNLELTGTPGRTEGLQRQVTGIRDDNKKQQAEFDKQKVLLTQEQAKVSEVMGLIANDAYACDILRSLWAAWPYDPKWAEPAVPRTTLNIIEMLNVTLHYTPEVREYAEAALTGGGLPPPPPPTEGAPGATAALTGPQAGVVMRVVGITPKEGPEATQYLNNGLIEKLKKDERTIRLKSLSGEEEILAKIVRLLPFRQAPEYQEFSGKTAVASPSSAAAAAPVVQTYDKGSYSWFEAVWVVRIPEKVKAEAAPNAGQAGAPGAAGAPAAGAPQSTPKCSVPLH
ncbi:MAG: type IV pilus assembly protein PilM [Planctomycetota bacterium]|nr:type IV pilus assembly protein PilM [Planctomycetota bacterium]